MKRECVTIVIVGHVDHGKSTVIGRLLSDTGSLPEGKLEQVKAVCEKTSTPFEYAFLIDALKDERKQGITIDTARCFFKTDKRDYIIFDAPGHIEFLKNMVTGASRAEAAILVIDAKQGIQENTKRHGMVVSMLGIKRIIVLVNKMDLTGFSREAFERLTSEYGKFLHELDIEPVCFIPISALQGDNLAYHSSRMDWYTEATLLQRLDELSAKEQPLNLPFRFPVQDVYKFTENNDDRRIIAGTIETGEIKIGNEIIFFPSEKKSRIKTIEEFNAPEKNKAVSGESIGFTLHDEIYVRQGEIMTTSAALPPKKSRRFKANIFWVGHAPLIKDKLYKLKLGTAQSPVKLLEITRILDTDDLSAVLHQESVNRHDAATCIFEATRPLAYDLVQDIETLSRFVIVDNFEIAGGGIITEEISGENSTVKNDPWSQGLVKTSERAEAYKHRGVFIVILGNPSEQKTRAISLILEKKLFDNGYKTYSLNLENLQLGTGHSEETIRFLGDLGRVSTDAGQILITDVSGYDDYDIEKLKESVQPFEMRTFVIGDGNQTISDITLRIPETESETDIVTMICRKLKEENIIFDYRD
ncbi:MAG: GTP-binding protein [Candidatus Omnitrophica bacterium]|nr:GTP-binding protein [Candidatus Omnitrophota bacterium]